MPLWGAEWDDARKTQKYPPRVCISCGYGRFADWAAVVAAHHPGSELSRLCRSTNHPWHSPFLERRFKFAVCCGRTSRVAAIPPQPGNRASLFGNNDDRFRFGLLSPRSERSHVVLGQIADDDRVYDHTCDRHRRSTGCETGSDSALAAYRSWRVQHPAVALDWRSATLRLGAVFSLRRAAGAVCPFSTDIQRHILLAH